jgi:flagellin-specific chaperone FliS
MDIARAKRDENIAEYILYIWQLEDLLRALKFEPAAVYTALVAPREGTDEWRLSALEWYMDIAGLLQKEDKTDGGHLDHTLHLIHEMNDLHLTLMEQPSGRRYRELFARLAPSLPGLRTTLGRDDVSDIELAFRALYAAMLYRMKGTRAEATDEVVELISPVIALLADTYHKVERGEVDIYREG